MSNAILIFLLVVALFVWICKRMYDRSRQDTVRRYDETCERIVDGAAKYKSVEKVEASINDIMTAYNAAKAEVSNLESYSRRHDIDALREQIAEIEVEKYERIASKRLDEFYCLYSDITSGCMNSFRDVDRLFTAKRKCIRAWQNYFAIDLSKYRTTIYPKRFMKDWFDDDYDPCMESHEALERKLDACIETMRPEYRRKMKLYPMIMEYVRNAVTVPRSDLLKVHFDGYIQEEVMCCYRDLIRKNRLVETKMGSRYFVSLSDKELAKKQPSDKEPECAT